MTGAPDEIDPFPALSEILITAIRPLREAGPQSDEDLAHALLQVGALLLLTRMSPERVAYVFLTASKRWTQRAKEDVGMSRRRKDTTQRIEAAVQAVLNFGRSGREQPRH